MIAAHGITFGDQTDGADVVSISCDAVQLDIIPLPIGIACGYGKVRMRGGRLLYELVANFQVVKVIVFERQYVEEGFLVNGSGDHVRHAVVHQGGWIPYKQRTVAVQVTFVYAPYQLRTHLKPVVYNLFGEHGLDG